MRRANDPQDASSRDGMRDIERDVLLASSGELSWWARARLRRRIARDPEARRLAETVSLLGLVTADAPSARSAGRIWWVSAAAAGLLLALVAWRFGFVPGLPAERDGAMRVIRLPDAAGRAPLHESSRQLVVASLGSRTWPDLIAVDPAAAGSASGESPTLPPWSYDALNERSLSTRLRDRSQ